MGLLRVILALSVAVAHFGGFFGYTIAGGFAAVQMFYIISGFYMATILTEKYDPRRDIVRKLAVQREQFLVADA